MENNKSNPINIPINNNIDSNKNNNLNDSNCVNNLNCMNDSNCVNNINCMNNLNYVNDSINEDEYYESDEDYYIRKRRKFDTECGKLMNDVKQMSDDERLKMTKSLIFDKENLENHLSHYNKEIIKLQRIIHNLSQDVSKLNKKILLVCKHDWVRTKENYQYGEYICTCNNCHLSQ